MYNGFGPERIGRFGHGSECKQEKSCCISCCSTQHKKIWINTHQRSKQFWYDVVDLKWIKFGVLTTMTGKQVGGDASRFRRQVPSSWIAMILQICWIPLSIQSKLRDEHKSESNIIWEKFYRYLVIFSCESTRRVDEQLMHAGERLLQTSLQSAKNHSSQ